MGSLIVNDGAVKGSQLDLRTRSLSVGVGQAAQGAVSLLGGALLGDQTGSAFVGSVFVSGPPTVLDAVGAAQAQGGFAGYQNYFVGDLVGPSAAGSSVSGTLIGSADSGVASTTGNVVVGRLINTDPTSALASGATTVAGDMHTAGSLNMDGVLQVGQSFNAAVGSSVSGSLKVDGDLGRAGVGFMIVGNVTSNDFGLVGSTAHGTLEVGGDTALGTGTNVVVGTLFGQSRASDTEGTRINEATGRARIDGTLTVDQAPAGQLLVGRALDGKADGELRIGTLAMADGLRFSQVQVGTAGAGEARGVLEVSGGVVRASEVQVGVSGSGSAEGIVNLSNTWIEADNILAGVGGGSAQIHLSDTQGSFIERFDFFAGTLSLERSFLDIGNGFVLDVASALRIGIDGQERGVQYGAIDAGTATLNGLLEIDLSTLVSTGSIMTFDLLRGFGGISGDFTQVSFKGLAAGYSPILGIEQFGEGGEIYRLTLVQAAAVPEPGTLGLLLLILPMLLWLALVQRKGAVHGFSYRR